MASLLFFIFLSAIITTEAQRGESIVNLGSSLTPTAKSSWRSQSGFYAFGFYQQANGYAVGVFFAGIPEKTVVWTANRDKPPALASVTLNFTNDGRLIMQSAQGEETAIANPPERAASASMLDSGNFVLYNSDKKIIWQSFESPTNTLLQGQRLTAGNELFSSVSESDQSTGIFRLIMQKDGNLVQYPVQITDAAEYAYWASGTDGKGSNVSLCLDDDGRLYLLNSTGTILKNLTQGNSHTKDVVYFMRIDVDGIFRLYSHNLDKNGNFSVIWSSSDNKCAPKGLCGLNGFCIMNDQDANCLCLPDFASVIEGNWSSGCERNFTAESCKSKDESMKYIMQAVPNTVWEDNSFSSLTVLTKDDCEAACLKDCNCEAATYRDGVCRKQKLPLRFGRRVLSDANIVFIKVAISTSTINKIEPLGRERYSRKDIMILGISFGAFGLIMSVISTIAIYKNRVRAYRRVSNSGNVELTMDVSLRSFTYSDLEKMTNGFKEELGRGSFGTVYKGTIWNGQKIVAVKRLEKVLTEGEKEFQTEMKVIGRTNHKNLVRLLGYCHDGENRLLVYEYMSNGSLADILFNPEKKLCWDERIEIARNIAKGILYLHEECESQIIHCDIKPQNILMDEYRCPKISDFGLAKLLKPNQTNTFTGIQGTKGYVAPEWHRNQRVTVKADVYSFGIVLLELICCRKNVDWSFPEEEAILEEWAYSCFEACELDKLVSGKDVDKRQLERIIKVGLWCILDEPSLRPSMKKVLLMLEGTVDVPIPPSPTSFLSTV
ncbi:G-type lectin S-receptor-like serine/threonine-protein kinase LECRK1 [Quercus lobata]|uniref:G-type lectin S-receptor-like serine/threonine-protein kinase LECRK1 n=1 Tax=Quercus lobata TaxID=97700 RepID=UPI0012474F13|nr:G-type lectin S-receptor-like serine/threonine-protein kinase LECRK1 [Quercus lobata]